MNEKEEFEPHICDNCKNMTEDGCKTPNPEGEAVLGFNYSTDIRTNNIVRCSYFNPSQFRNNKE